MLPAPTSSLRHFTLTSGLPAVSICTPVSESCCSKADLSMVSRSVPGELYSLFTDRPHPITLQGWHIKRPASSSSGEIILRLCFALFPKISPGNSVPGPAPAADVRAHPLLDAFLLPYHYPFLHPNQQFALESMS